MQEYAYSQRRMGTDATVTVVTDSEIVAHSITTKAFADISKAEQQFSRFIPKSELSQLNTEGTLIVSETFMAVLKKALTLHQLTAGAYNPLLQIAQQGYRQNYTRITDTVQTASLTPYNLTLSDLFYDNETREVRLAPTQQLDFGGMLKGYLSEQIASTIMSLYPACTGTIINLGGDLHTEGLDENGLPFTFFITNPITDTETPVTLTNTSLVTSGTYKRHWQTSLGPRHHILSADGLTNPVSPVVSATVLYPDGAVAEAFAKYLLITHPTHLDTKLLPAGLQYHLVLTDGSNITTII